ncbi:putative lipoprotein [Peptoniphilus harei ACS-146-V-Sch2b]|uniref:Putative lipoprotein n=1 Tax=Peptoniphilus harei ACS-146-V-Sch2b TaxID=908338 RepID=E4L116_9FIRM|nr:DUF4300 family protein [Peptoniphilus harei]EFR32148.1 putative lipoprotein [Peptoniphilus harei ACS-146-V-Sch2b]MDU4448314.1 DUF4300 family protein [Anaerococcus vaginalis]MDU7532692.1 DUF4300 family protein [Peptoniphilus harei]
MKKKSIIFITCLSLLTSACGNKNKDNKIEDNSIKTEKAEVHENKSGDYLVSNMNDDETLKKIKRIIEKNLNKKNGEVFASLVRDYNKSIPKELLSGDFTDPSKEDKFGKIMEMRSSIKHEYPDTNCRINSFLLLKDNLSIKEDLPIDDEILFMDKEALKSSNLFNEEDLEKFYKLFSRVKTSSSKDPRVHAKVMEKFLSKVDFPKDVRMLSVVLNDNLDGDYLFIGHVGVLLPLDDGYLFLEKISFEEPYQALKFSKKEDAYKYLKNKYKDYIDPEVAPPFIIDNDKYVDL